MSGKLHVFAGSFLSQDDARRYSEPQWQPEPSDSAGKEEYSAWEDRNPIWCFRDDLDGVGLDEDFIETVGGADRYDYLASYLVSARDLVTVRTAAPHANILVLVFPNALSGSAVPLRSTSRLTYCGAFGFRYP